MTELQDEGESQIYCMTPAGFRKLQEELDTLKTKERPEITKVVEWAASNGDRSENGDYLYGKKRMREIDSRIRFLSSRIKAAKVIDPKTQVSVRVGFGATVTLLDEQDNERTFTIVGVDEVDVLAGRISYKSPLGRALQNSKVGDVVEYHSPKGPLSVEVISITYAEVVY